MSQSYGERLTRNAEDFDAIVFEMLVEINRLREENERLSNLLHEIGDLAHEKSTGPTIQDGYWEIRRLAYEE